MVTVLFYIFVACAVIQLLYFFCFSFVLFTKSLNKKSRKIPISVIVCAKNEEENLHQFIPFILNQKYSNFELVLINDASTDATLEVMESFQKKHQFIKIVNVENIESFWGNKKYALTLGIKAATNKHLLFTDADCKPISPLWIERMASQFENEKSIVLGYGKYSFENSFVNFLVRFETLITAVQYFTYAKFGAPYMGVGRNLAYTKDEFFKVNGFIKHIKLKSGDDDLFIQEAATNENTSYTIDPHSFTTSKAPATIKAWFRQKRRHITTSSYYQFKHKFLLGLFIFSKFLVYGLGILLCWFVSLKILLPIILIYFTSLYIVFGMASKKFHEKKLVVLLPFLDFFLLIFQFTIFSFNTFSKPSHWK